MRSFPCLPVAESTLPDGKPRRRSPACRSGELPGHLLAPIGAAQCAEHIGATRVACGLAAGELRPAMLLPASSLADQWVRFDP
jgi:hypothetical protein